MNPLFIQSIARHALGFFGGALVTKGYIDEASIEPLAGAVMTIGAFVWSLVDKRGR